LKRIRSLAPEGSPGIVMSVLSRMPAVLAKLAELAVAGLASAAGAYLFGQFTKPATPPPPPAQVVRIEPVQEELVRAVRSENAALIEELRKAEAAKEAAEASPRTATVAAPKPPKASQAVGASHKPAADRGGLLADHKGERVNEAEAKAPTASVDERVPSGVAAPLVLAPGIEPAPPAVDAASAIDQGPAREPELRWFARLRRIPEIFRPAPVAPRPPLPVGEFVQRAM
jgi:hypothetical protein